jgi:LysM repeat protein
MVSNCDEFYLVMKDDTCYDIAQKYSITLDRFYAWNPAVGAQCGSLWPENYVCVSIIGFPVSKTTLITTSKITLVTTRKTTPITTSKTTLIATSRPQTSSFVMPPPCLFDPIKGEYVCEPTATTTKRTTTKPGNGIVTPTPIQTGVVSNCKKFYKVITGDGCWAIANANGIKLEDFYKWNPAVGSTCATLYPDNYVCVGV